MEWGGHVRLMGQISWPDDSSVLLDEHTFNDQSIDFRLKHKWIFCPWGYVETHYEAIGSRGDTLQNQNSIKSINPNLWTYHTTHDANRIMNLTHYITDQHDHTLYHRLDRVAVTLVPEWGNICIGRQALTIGNGLIFNPMDLFNPFSPTEISRDYKIGDDMVTGQFPINTIGDIQLLYVPRRDETHDISWNASSLAGKLHVLKKNTEVDVLFAKHFKDYVSGFGVVGNSGDAVWRYDLTWTVLDKDAQRTNYVSCVANIDYSWTVLDKNIYALLEYYYNGLGNNSYSTGINSALSERLIRGEVFTLSKYYLGTEFRVELHPLINFHLTMITNLSDPSFLFQPRVVWDVRSSIQCISGATLYHGQRDTEFGGFNIAQGVQFKPANTIFLWVNMYF